MIRKNEFMPDSTRSGYFARSVAAASAASSSAASAGPSAAIDMDVVHADDSSSSDTDSAESSSEVQGPPEDEGHIFEFGEGFNSRGVPLQPVGGMEIMKNVVTNCVHWLKPNGRLLCGIRPPRRSVILLDFVGVTDFCDNCRRKMSR